MRRLLPALGLSAALIAGGCQHPDGSVDWGNTLLVGAGVGLAAAAIAGAASSGGGSRRYASNSGYRSHSYDRSRGGRGYRGW
jgi:hypothetical protein